MLRVPHCRWRRWWFLPAFSPARLRVPRARARRRRCRRDPARLRALHGGDPGQVLTPRSARHVVLAQRGTRLALRIDRRRHCSVRTPRLSTSRRSSTWSRSLVVDLHDQRLCCAVPGRPEPAHALRGHRGVRRGRPGCGLAPASTCAILGAGLLVAGRPATARFSSRFVLVIRARGCPVATATQRTSAPLVRMGSHLAATRIIYYFMNNLDTLTIGCDSARSRSGSTTGRSSS